MSEYYHVVPWFNSDEWHRVYDEIYSPTSNKQEALNLLQMWKARCPSLPSGVESTLTLLEVHIQDEKSSDNVSNDQLLRLAYSSAIMRFVNHMLDTEAAKGSSLYQAAKNLGVPDWIVDMRHDTAHSNNLPPLNLLREAAQISIDWLKNNYWDKYKEHIKDYISSQVEIDSDEENKIAALMNFAISLGICAHSKCKIKNLAEIPDPSMRESIVNDARDLFGESIDLSNLKTVSVMALINIMNSQSKKLLRAKDTISNINKALLGEDSLFLSIELVNFLGNNDFNSKNKLNMHYVQCFEVLLSFLHSNDLLLDFVMELIKVTQCNKNDDNRCRIAALWVSEILKAFRKSKQFFVKMYKTSSEDILSKPKKELKLLYHHWFPNEKSNGLLLDMHKPVPEELMSINFIQPIISSYNTYLTYFIKDFLNLVEPALPKLVTEKICKLAKLISSPDGFSVVSSKIYTVDDLKSADDMVYIAEHESGNNSDSSIQMMDISQVEYIQEEPKNSTWKLASSDHNWSACPIGLLPWQQNTNNAMNIDT